MRGANRDRTLEVDVEVLERRQTVVADRIQDDGRRAAAVGQRRQVPAPPPRRDSPGARCRTPTR